MTRNLKPIAILIAACVLAVTSGCMTPMDQTKRIRFLGDPAPVSAAGRTVSIAPDTTSIVVTGGDTIAFAVGTKSFAWNFDGPGAYNFDLTLVAPPGMLTHKVMVYVNPDPFVNGGF